MTEQDDLLHESYDDPNRLACIAILMLPVPTFRNGKIYYGGVEQLEEEVICDIHQIISREFTNCRPSDVTWVKHVTVPLVQDVLLAFKSQIKDAGSK